MRYNLSVFFLLVDCSEGRIVCEKMKHTIAVILRATIFGKL